MTGRTLRHGKRSALLALPLLGSALSVPLSVPAWASHPLLTDDTNVLGKGVWEFEVHGESSRRNGPPASETTEVLAKLGYGVGPTLDVEAELPYVREVVDGNVTSGRGDAAVAAKWRFYESENGFSMAIKPGVFLPTGRDEIGLGAGQVRWGASLLGAYELGKVEFIGHVAYVHNRNEIDERVDLWHLSAAVRWSVSERLKLVLDVARESSPDPAEGPANELVVGVTFALRSNIDLGIGLKYGLNDVADDRGVRAGIKLRW
jgi:hypothetical protein